MAKVKEETRSGSPFTAGLMIGFLLGVVASLAVIMFIKSNDSPFAVQSISTESRLADKIANDVKVAKQNASAAAAKNDKNQEDKVNFDFYSILPGAESKVSVDEAVANNLTETAVENSVPEVGQPSYYIQVSAYKNEEEADNLKAKLAMQGVEAIVQAANIPEKGVWHRVRVGPLKSVDEINRTKENLLTSGFKADLIKIKN